MSLSKGSQGCPYLGISGGGGGGGLSLSRGSQGVSLSRGSQGCPYLGDLRGVLI